MYSYLKRGKALLVILVVLTLLVSACGCSKEKGQKETTPTEKATTTKGQETTTTQATTQESTKKVIENFNPTGYPIVNEPITIKVSGPMSATTTTWEGMNLFEHLTKVTGIEFEFEAYTSNVWSEKKSLIFASNDLPDLLIGAGLSTKERMQYGSDGQLIALNELIAEYCPNIQEAFANVPDAKALSTSADGNIYALPLINQMPRDMHARYWISTTWLKNVDMEVPQTLDEFYDVLVAFKLQDANGNGDPDDEIPMSGIIGSSIDAMGGLILNALGINAFRSDYGLVGTKDDKVACKNTLPEYKEYLKFMHKLYKERLLDNDVFVQTTEQFRAKGAAGILGCFYDSASYITCGPEIGYDYTQFDALTSHWNDTKMVTSSIGISIGKGAITSVNQYPEATIRLLDYCFSEEGSIVNRNGEEGIGWRWIDKENGIWENLCPEGYDNTQAWRAVVTAIEAFPSWYRVEYQNGQGNQNAFWLNEMTMKYSYPYFKTQYPTLSYSEEDLDIMAPIENDVKSYVLEMRARFITEGGIDEGWEEYVATIKNMGIDKVIEINQPLYDAYVKALK